MASNILSISYIQAYTSIYPIAEENQAVYRS